MAHLSHQPSTFTQRAVRWTIFLGATALVVYLCLQILRPFTNVIAWSAVLAITFHPLHQYLIRKTGRVSLSALICSALVVVAFVIPLLFIAGLAVSEFIALGDSLQRTFTGESGMDTALGRAYGWLTGRLGLDATAMVAWLRQHASEVTRLLAQSALAIAAGVTGAFVSFIFIIFAMFLMFRDGDRIVAAIPVRTPTPAAVK